MGTKKGQVRKTARRAYTPIKPKKRSRDEIDNRWRIWWKMQDDLLKESLDLLKIRKK